MLARGDVEIFRCGNLFSSKKGKDTGYTQLQDEESSDASKKKKKESKKTKLKAKTHAPSVPLNSGAFPFKNFE